MNLMLSLILAGAFLIIAEVLLPGMVAGICGTICLIIATIIAYTTYGSVIGTAVLVGEVIFIIVTFLLWVKFFPKTGFGKKFILDDKVNQSSAPQSFEKLLDKTGTTVTPLHPSGLAKIESKRYDVISEGSMIEKDMDIKVVKVEGSRIVVRVV
ncbi:MAG: NfeD family protein [Verrucomicrobiota bacterium]